MTITCPYCYEVIDVSEDLCDYTWKGNAANDRFSCPDCGEMLEVAVTGYIDTVTCLTEDDRLSVQEAYEQYCEMKYDAAKEEVN